MHGMNVLISWPTPKFRIVARSLELETELIADLVEKWLTELEPGEPPIKQKKELVKNQAIAVTYKLLSDFKNHKRLKLN